MGRVGAHLISAKEHSCHAPRLGMMERSGGEVFLMMWLSERGVPLAWRTIEGGRHASVTTF